LADILPKLYGEVLLPRTVALELNGLGTPEPVSRWISHPPPWLQIIAPASAPPLVSLSHLDPSGYDAILLAIQTMPLVYSWTTGKARGSSPARPFRNRHLENCGPGSSPWTDRPCRRDHLPSPDQLSRKSSFARATAAHPRSSNVVISLRIPAGKCPTTLMPGTGSRADCRLARRNQRL